MLTFSCHESHAETYIEHPPTDCSTVDADCWKHLSSNANHDWIFYAFDFCGQGIFLFDFVFLAKFFLFLFSAKTENIAMVSRESIAYFLDIVYSWLHTVFQMANVHDWFYASWVMSNNCILLFREQICKVPGWFVAMGKDAQWRAAILTTHQESRLTWKVGRCLFWVWIKHEVIWQRLIEKYLRLNFTTQL